MSLQFTVYGLRFFKGTFTLPIKALCFCGLIFFSFNINAQVGTTSFGFVVKPIFPSSYFRTGAQTNQATDTIGNTYQFKLAQTSGFSAGAVVRKGITKNISAETGIQFVKRKYQVDITDDSTGFTGRSDFKIIGYEIPLQVLTFVQLSQSIWMNVALGTSLDMFPSDLETRGAYYKTKSLRKSKLTVFNAGLLANLGFEYRTEKSGIIYIGSSYHRSFKDTYRSVIGYYRDIKAPYPTATSSFNLKGDYLTLDLRYYFQGDVSKKRKAKQK